MIDLSPSIGKIAGIEIQLHWSFILLLLFTLLISWSLFAIFVLLFLFVLLHELAHSLTSLKYHIKVKKIILLPIGGVSIIDFDVVKPDAEIKISLAGPLASIVIGLVFGAFIPFVSIPAVNQALVFIFEINIFLGVFNIIPAFPLDGGRLLRAYLQKTRTRLKATELTVKVSNVMLVLIVVGTVLYVLFAGYSLESGELLVLYDLIVAMFIYSGAQQELQSAYVTEYTSDLYAGDAMSTDNYIMIRSDATVHDLYGAIRARPHSIALFKSGSEIKLIKLPAIGKVKEADAFMKKRVSEFGVTLEKIPSTVRISEALSRMQQNNYEIMAVTKKGKFAGILLPQNVETMMVLHIAKRRRQENK